jgi:hypothetical protein
MTLLPDGRPAFIDPEPTDHAVPAGEGRSPVWYRVAVLVIAVSALFYVFAYFSGPRASSHHNFVHGRDALSRATSASATPAPSAARTPSAAPTVAPGPEKGGGQNGATPTPGSTPGLKPSTGLGSVAPAPAGTP